MLARKCPDSRLSGLDVRSEVILSSKHDAACIAIVTIYFLYLEMTVLNAEMHLLNRAPLVVYEGIAVGFVFIPNGQTIINGVVPIHRSESVDYVECARTCFNAGTNIGAIASNGLYVAVVVNIGIFAVVVGARTLQVPVGAVGIVDVALNADRVGDAELSRTESRKANRGIVFGSGVITNLLHQCQGRECQRP